MKPFAAYHDDRTDVDTPAGAIDHLPVIDAEQARWAHEAASALAAAMPNVRCSVAHWPADVGECYHGAQWCFYPGEPWRAPAGASGEALAAALDKAEDWLDCVEAATGLAVEFDRHAVAKTGLTAIRVSDSAGQTIALLAPLAAPRPREARAPVIVRLSFVAARLPLAEAERLGPGDLVVLESASWQAEIEADGLAPGAALRFDPRTGLLAAGPASHPIFEEPGMSQTPSPRDFTVPIAIRLPSAVVDSAGLDALAQGGTLDIGPVAEGLNVTLLIGGRHFATGEIVTIGDRFAVLVAEPAPVAAADEEQGDAEAPAPNDYGLEGSP